MNIIREIVGGPKNRYKAEGYNLDLTYISSRIIAMAFPGSGIQKIYRNSVDAVSEFLQAHHKNSYMILNISNREVDQQKLKNVFSFEWEDHKSPPLVLLFNIADLVTKYLSQKPENVVIIHCNHGKGRTGTLICCLLLYLGAINNAKEAMKYYAKIRFETEGMGVTQPCQITYIEYFNDILLQKPRNKLPLVLTKIQLIGSHKLTNPYFKLKIVQENDYMLSTKKKEEKIIEINKQNERTIKLVKGVKLVGDILLEIKSEEKIGKNLAGYYFFNTAMINFGTDKDPSSDKEQKITLNFQDLSPLSAQKSGLFSNTFMIVLTFHRCIDCQSELKKGKQICKQCQQMQIKQQVQQNRIDEVARSRIEKYKVFENTLYGDLDKQFKLKRSLSL